MQGKESKHSAIKQEIKSGPNRYNPDKEKYKWLQLMSLENFIYRTILLFQKITTCSIMYLISKRVIQTLVL